MSGHEKTGLLREDRFGEICVCSGDLLALALLLELTLVGERDFEHLHAEPEGARCGKGRVAGYPELGALCIAGNVWLEPQVEKEPHDRSEDEVGGDGLWCDFHSN